MAAQQVEHSAETPVELLTAAMDATDLAWQAEIRRFRIAAEWADLHPVESIWDAAKIGRGRVGKECRSRWSPYH